MMGCAFFLRFGEVPKPIGLPFPMSRMSQDICPWNGTDA